MFAAEQVADIQIATLPKLAIPLLSRIPLLGPVFFTQNILTYLAYLMIPAALFLLYRTSLGLTLRSTGENPVAVDVAGLNVNRIRFLTVLVAGAVSGLAGSFYTVGYLGMFTSNIIGGRGWIAFAICFLGNWGPRGTVLGTLAFGLADAVSIYIQAVSRTFTGLPQNEEEGKGAAAQDPASYFSGRNHRSLRFLPLVSTIEWRTPYSAKG